MTVGSGADSVRVTVTCGSRRVDLVLPAAIPVAELVPELVCLTKAPTPPASWYRLTTLTGVELTPEVGLAAHGVVDGSVLLLSATAPTPPRVYDDPAESMAEAVHRAIPARSPSPGHGRLVAAAPVVLAGAALLSGDAALPGPPHREVVAIGAVGLVLAVVAGYLLPRLALATSGLLADPAEFAARTDAARDAEVGVAHDLLLAGSSASVPLLVVSAAAVAAAGPFGALASCLGCGVVLLRSRRHHSARVARVDVLAGGLGLLTTTAAVLATQPGWRPVAAVLLVGAGAAAWQAPPPAPSLRWSRIADLAETLALVALLPVLVLAAGLDDLLRG